MTDVLRICSAAGGAAADNGQPLIIRFSLSIFHHKTAVLIFEYGCFGFRIL